MSDQRIPVEIARVQNGDGNPRMVPHAQLGDLMGHPDLDLQKEMDALVTRYSAVISSAKAILSAIEARHRGSGRVIPGLYWQLGDLLNRFIESNEGSPIFLNGIKGHFMRDLGISDASWKKILRLRHLVPSMDLIDDARSWTFYRDAPSERIRSAIENPSGGRRSLPDKESAPVHPRLPLLEQKSHDVTSAQGPIADRVNSLTPHSRSRIEVHLPPEALSKLRDLAENLDLSMKRPEAAVARALLLAILDNEARRNIQFGELLNLAKKLIRAGSIRKHG